MEFRQINFNTVFDDIDEDRYIVKVPPFVAEMKRPAPQANGGSGGGAQPQPDKKRQKVRQERGKKIENEKVIQELMVPNPLTYEAVFHPHIRYKVPTTPHEDGVGKCNNYHHRGYCWEKGCRFAGSHGKTLTGKEKDDSKKYLAALMAKYNSKNNSNNPVVPTGDPPKGTGEKI